MGRAAGRVQWKELSLKLQGAREVTHRVLVWTDTAVADSTEVLRGLEITR